MQGAMLCPDGASEHTGIRTVHFNYCTYLGVISYFFGKERQEKNQVTSIFFVSILHLSTYRIVPSRHLF